VRPDRADLIDDVLSELPPERARAVAARVAADPSAAAERDELLAAIDLVREAAAGGWEAPAGAGRLRWLRPAIAVAAVLAIVAGVFLLNGGVPARAIYEPDLALGYLLCAETDSRGRVPEPSTTDVPRLREGKVDVAPIGSAREFRVDAGDALAFDTEARTTAESAARIDLPGGGILFLEPLSAVRIRRHQSGGAAVRLMDGAVSTVAGDAMLSLAVHGTDLLLEQRNGAALLRKNPDEAVALRGRLFQRLGDGRRFEVPESERLPAACAREPRTTSAPADALVPDGYRDLVHDGFRVADVEWAREGRSTPLAHDGDTLVYLKVVPTSSGTLAVAFGGEPRTFAVREGRPLRIRLRLSDLGPGPVLTVTGPGGLREARVLDVG